MGWQHNVEVGLKRRDATRAGFNAEVAVQEFLENCGYEVIRSKYAPGFDLLATKGKEALYVQVKTLTEDRGQFRLSYKELQTMLWESEFGDGRGFNPDCVPCLAVVRIKGRRRCRDKMATNGVVASSEFWS
jgi:hypothetical protein